MKTQKEFEKAISKVSGSFDRAGRTAPIAAALGCYKDSQSKNEAQAQQAAYLYQVVKNCNTWLRTKIADEKKDKDTYKARKRIILEVLNEANLELQQYPIIRNALDKYARKKGEGIVRTTTQLQGAYALEGQAYRQLKAQGQFVDPGKRRFTPSTTLMNEMGAKERPGPLKAKGSINELNLDDYMKLDTLLARQYKVLYLSKLHRLNFLVAIEGGQFLNAVDGKPVQMPGSIVKADLGQCPNKDAKQQDLVATQTQLYACDKYGNLFVIQNNRKDDKNRKIQVNHSTLCAGNDVLCAGTISIKNGVLKGISNLSGHYKPGTAALRRMLTELQNQGVVLDNGVIILDMEQGIYTTADKYITQDYTDRQNEMPVKLALAAMQ
jgi:hypothetical protein